MPSIFDDEDEEVMDEDHEVESENNVEDSDSESHSEEDEEVMDEDHEVDENNGKDSESHSEGQVDVEDDEEEYMEDLDDDEDDLGSDNVQEHEECSHEQASAVAAATAAPAPAPAPALPDVRVRTRTPVPNVTVCDSDALECGVCFLALRPPIFQCEVGHVVCSACRDKLEATGNGSCHVCRVATRGGGYHRCHAMENLLDCIRVPCPYAAHGCDATPPYHGQESHRQACPHAPCRCPGGESCGFAGSTAALMHHFAGAHSWPCTTKVRAREAFSIRLHVGFNFILLAGHQDRDDGDEQAAAATGIGNSVPCRLFLLNVTQERLGRAISVLCIHPHASAANGAQQRLPTQCELVFSRKGGGAGSLGSHKQSSVFKVVCTDLSNGLPNTDDCFQFFVHNDVLGVGDDGKNSIMVKARIIN